MTTAIARIIAAAWLLVGLGCGSGRRLNGTYVGVRPFTVRPGQDSFVARQLATVKLTARPDGTADLSDSGIPVSGRIEYGTDGATFVPLTIAGVAIEKEIPEIAEGYRAKLEPGKNDTWIFKGGLVLKKMAQP